MNRIDSIASLNESYDIVVVGAGPAGMSAASTAARLGCRVLVVDENPDLGGQIYRAVTTTPVRDRAILGEDYWRGAAICDDFIQSAASWISGAVVWSVNGLGGDASAIEVGISKHGSARLINARHVILATGAIERPFPIPGWTMPGVMTAGAAQIALKSSGLVPDGRVVLAGCGPLMVLLGAQLQAAGANIVAVVDTTPRGNWRQAAPYFPAFLASSYALKGLGLLFRARRRLRFINGATALRVEGTDHARRLVVTRASADIALDCDLVLLHHGVVPNVNMSNAIGWAHHFDAEQHCWTPTVDAWFTSGLAGASIAGDAGGIGGAESAALRGAIAALEVARRFGKITVEQRDQQAAPLRRGLEKSLRGRRFLDILYRPSRAFLAPADADTIACRCEEVTVGQIRETTRLLGVVGPNQMKAFLRCGMGPCQGRLCGPTVYEVMSETRGVSMPDIGTYRLRPPFKPVTVAEIASLPQTDAAVKAVVR